MPWQAQAREEESPTAPAATVVVAVGSTNPVKVNAVQEAFRACFPGWMFDVRGIKAASGVSDQPMTDKETRSGAINRARNAAGALRESHGDGATVHFSVGLEGGCAEDADGFEEAAGSMICYAWMAVVQLGDDGTEARWGFARTASMPLPPVVAELIRGGMELGLADDKVFGRTNSKQSDGSVGLFTRGLINRTGYYSHALTLALVPWMNPDKFSADLTVPDEE